MFSTPEIVRLLQASNPGRPVTEYRLRHAIRDGRIPSPRRVGLGLVWTHDDVGRAAVALGLRSPIIEESPL